MSASDITVINPLGAPMRGSTHVPGDKSISHRAVLFSAMAEGTSRVSGVLDSADVRSSIGAVRALGAQVSLENSLTAAWPAASPAGGRRPLAAGGTHRLRQLRHHGAPAHGHPGTVAHPRHAYPAMLRCRSAPCAALPRRS